MSNSFQAKSVQEPGIIDYTPDADVSAGDIIVMNDLVGIAKLAILAGELGALATAGIFDITKGTGSASAIALGEKVYWDAVSEVATTTAEGNTYLGKCVAAADADDTTVRVQLEQ